MVTLAVLVALLVRGRHLGDARLCRGTRDSAQDKGSSEAVDKRLWGVLPNEGSTVSLWARGEGITIDPSSQGTTLSNNLDDAVLRERKRFLALATDPPEGKGGMERKRRYGTLPLAKDGNTFDDP